MSQPATTNTAGPLLSLIIGLAIIGWVLYRLNSNQSIIPNGPSAASCISIEKWAFESEGRSQYIVGMARNTCDKKFEYADVLFNLYDSGGARVGTAIDNIHNLDPKVAWKFRAFVDVAGVTNANVGEISGH